MCDQYGLLKNIISISKESQACELRTTCTLASPQFLVNLDQFVIHSEVRTTVRFYEADTVSGYHIVLLPLCYVESDLKIIEQT